MKNKLPHIVLKKESAIRIDRCGKKSTKVWIFKCATDNCKHEIRVHSGKVKQYTGYCTSCHRKNKPFWTTYSRLLYNCELKEIKNSITYEEFLSFTEIKACTYCSSAIRWIPFGQAHKNLNMAYNLDRKNSDGPYSKSNCVVCCKTCNWAKNNLFTHKEFLKIGKVIGEVLRERD